MGPCIFKQWGKPFEFRTYVPFERKPSGPMKVHINRLMDKIIPWPNTFSEQDGFAEAPMTLTGSRCHKEDRSRSNTDNGMTPVFWQGHYVGEEMLHGHPKLLPNHYSGLRFGSRKAADNHALLIKNQVNCRISCLP